MMQDSLKLVLSLLALATGMVQPALAQDDASVFAVTYIEVTPSATERAASLLGSLAQSSRTEAGNLRFQVLQRTGRPNHFAILDAWSDQASRDRHAAASHTRSFRDTLAPLLYSPYDERPSTPIMATSGAGGEGEVYVITHVDIIPTALEEGTALVDALVRASRQDPGAVDIGVIAQNNRRNHMTLFEVWTSAEHRIAHASTQHAMHFRDELLSRSGSLYDERIYRRL
jgi:quinol monooxygenase YgiN